MTARLAIIGIRAYQLIFSSFTGGSCRFLPSCSEYAVEAMRRHGAWRGSLLTARRIARCHPFGGSGHDPVPADLRQFPRS